MTGYWLILLYISSTVIHCLETTTDESSSDDEFNTVTNEALNDSFTTLTNEIAADDFSTRDEYSEDGKLSFSLQPP
jgi:hypothetical protein